MRLESGYGLLAGLAALPFGAGAGFLQLRGLLIWPAAASWMLFWLCAALLVWTLTAGCLPCAAAPESGWHKSGPAADPLLGLGPCLISAQALCLLLTLGQLCLHLPAAVAACWGGGLCAALVWLLLCLLALACLRRDACR